MVQLKRNLLRCANFDDSEHSRWTVQVLSIRQAKGLDFAKSMTTVVIIDFFKSLNDKQQTNWKQMLQREPTKGFCDEHPEVEAHLKLLYYGTPLLIAHSTVSTS